jgi:hypothetical protein
VAHRQQRPDQHPRPGVGEGDRPFGRLALGITAAQLVIDGLVWRAVAAMFGRERLIT